MIKKMLTIILSLIATISVNGMQKGQKLLQLPIKACNLIAHYLTFKDIEYEKEFIERARTTPCNVIKKCSLSPKDNNPLYAFNDDDIYMAESRTSTLSAFMHKKIKLFTLPYCSFSRDFILSIENTTTAQKQSYEIDGWNEFSTDHAAIAFNKQETHIIILPKNTHPIIIPINVAPQSTCPDKKTLQHYFEQRLVCKKIRE